MDVIKYEPALENETLPVPSVNSTQLVDVKHEEHTTFTIVKKEIDVSCLSHCLCLVI